MTLVRITRNLFAGGALFVGMLASAGAQMVSIKGDTVNMRAAPAGEVQWQLGRGYPLKVVERKGDWLRVVDFENDGGWVAKRLTSRTPHAIVKTPVANLRSGPGTRYRVVHRAEYGDVFRVLEKRKSWMRVQDEDARTGWIARRLLWGS
jgi:SH3-like domain-containing protein